jgi:hypothetical protein
MGGFSESNVWRMRAFYLAFSQDAAKLAQPVREMKHSGPPQAVARIPWGHKVPLIEKLKNSEHRFWYAQKAMECRLALRVAS